MMSQGLCVIFGVIFVVSAAPTLDKVLGSYRSSLMEESIIANGYLVERHNVTTSDGYILGVFRIPYPRHQTSADADRPVVFLMHGLFGQSINFLSIGPELSIGYNLADAGFDVWFGNARGNVHSRAHTTLDPDDPEEKFQFFDFSYDDIGMKDVPAMIDYVLEYTGEEKLHYIGHSQGGTVFLVMASMLTEYNEKMASVHLLAGVGYMEYFPDEQLKSLAQFTEFIYAFALEEGLVEFTPEMVEIILPEGQQVTVSDLCFGSIKYKNMCDLVGARYFLRDGDSNDLGQLDYQFGGGSLKQIAHYGQNIRDQLFRRFDYGTAVNQDLYGSNIPPLYDLSLITSNVVMHYTVNDNLLDERDVLAMAEDMPNTSVRKVARETFEHADFASADDAKELVTDWIIESILNVHNGVVPEEEEEEEEESEEATQPVAPEEETETDSAVALSFSVSTVFLLSLVALNF